MEKQVDEYEQEVALLEARLQEERDITEALEIERSQRQQ